MAKWSDTIVFATLPTANFEEVPISWGKHFRSEKFLERVIEAEIQNER